MKQTLKIGDKVKVIGSDRTFIIKDIGRNLNGKRIYKQSKGSCWGNVLSELQLIKSKTKKMKKYKYSRKEIVKMIKTKCFFGHNESKAVRWLLATQSQPIKEEEKCEHIFKYDDDLRTSACYRTCIKCGEYELNVNSKAEIRPKQQSKDIEPFKTLFTYSKNYPDLCATQTPEFKKWVKQVTDTLNSLTKRNKK